MVVCMYLYSIMDVWGYDGEFCSSSSLRDRGLGMPLPIHQSIVYSRSPEPQCTLLMVHFPYGTYS